MEGHDMAVAEVEEGDALRPPLGGVDEQVAACNCCGGGRKDEALTVRSAN